MNIIVREPLSVPSGRESVKVGLIKYINVTSTGIVLPNAKILFESRRWYQSPDCF